MSEPGDNDRTLFADEHRVTLWALRIVGEQLEAVGDEPWRWQWVIIATHNALQCVMVLALDDWHGLQILRENHRKKMVAWLNGDRADYPEVHLDRFLNLYDKIKDEVIGDHSGQDAFQVTEALDRAVRCLNGYRNEFVHFAPQSWIMTRHELAVLTCRSLDLLRFLVFDSGAIRLHDRDLAHEIEESISRARGLTQALQEQLADPEPE